MVISVVLNASWDKTLVSSNLKTEGVAVAEKVYAYAGGKGVNLARALRELGDDSLVLGFIGGVTGELIKSALSTEGISHSFTETVSETRSNLTVSDPVSGRELHIVEPGGEVSNQELSEFLTTFRKHLREATFVALVGSIPPGVPSRIYADLVGEAKRSDLPCAVDTRELPSSKLWRHVPGS